MTDRPDPFDDLEFETAEAVDADVAVPQATTSTPASPASAAAAGAAPDPLTAAVPTAAPSRLVAYLTLGASALAFAGTVSVVVVTVMTAKPEEPAVSPERATLGRIEAMLNGQQRRLDHLATATATTSGEPSPGAADLAALTAVVRANQQSIDRLPALLKAQAPRATGPVRQVVVTKPASGPADPRVGEVLKAQAAVQRQVEALAAKMARTTAACVTQNDGAVHYP